jgi:alkylation response protein AidB-like acyl-CoA dehydrogenase
MDLEFDFEQIEMSRTARTFLQRHWPTSLVREMQKDKARFPVEIWQKMAELGWMGLVFPEEYGGSNASFLTLVVLLEEMGRALLMVPFVGTVVCGGLAILNYGSKAQKEKLLPEITGGRLILAPAFIEPNLSESQVEEQIAAKGKVYVLSGIRLFVPYAHVADLLMWDARLTEGDTLFLTDTKQPGVKCAVLPSIASDRHCEVTLDKVGITESNILGQKGHGREILDKIEQMAAAAYCGFIVGILQKVLEMTVEYAKQRIQFERPIGSFQAIQHQCANMLIDIETSKLLTHQAAWKLSQQIPASKEVSLAKARASDAARRVCLLGIKIHGGVGLMQEYDMSLYFKMAKAAESAFGNGDFHREVVAQQLGL